jgi:hypothetical protein
MDHSSGFSPEQLEILPQATNILGIPRSQLLSALREARINQHAANESRVVKSLVYEVFEEPDNRTISHLELNTG